jgi:serine/threonine-protein kinase
MLDGNLMAVPFDLARLQTTGPPVPVVEDVRRSSNGEATFAVSRSGFLVYAPAEAFNDLDRTLVWVDRSGHQELVGAPPRGYMELRLSPDGMRIALDIRDQNNDVWVWDLARQNLTRLTFFPQYGIFARWARDGRRIFFGSRRGGAALNLYWQAADGSGQAERLAESLQLQRPHSVSPDGTHLLFTEEAAQTRTDIHMLSLDDRKAVPLIRTPFKESNPEVSPDGRWLAYQSDESGAIQVYVRPFPAVDTGRWQVSTDGGSRPVWARNGRELFYAASVPADESALRMMAVPIQAGATFAAGAPEQLFEGRFASLGNDVGRNYDVSADGRKFLMINEAAAEQTANAGGTFVFVMNWFDELRRLAPPR